MRQPNGNPHGFTAALSVCTIVSRNWICGEKIMQEYFLRKGQC